jgi:bifunctional UDP-N-acetylglucosamine pyrophosphorylase/glucosamine-1-phosphate N-acetyltransferase
MKLSTLILANDTDSRFHSDTPEVLHSLAGQPIIHHLLDLVARLEATPIVVAVPESKDAIQEAVGDEVRCEALATPATLAGALQRALDAMEEMPEQLVVLPADTPLLRGETLRALVAQQIDSEVPVAAIADSDVLCLGRGALHKLEEMDAAAFETWLAQTWDEGASVIAEEPDELLCIETRVDLSRAATIMRRRINERWMLAGVTLTDPATTYIDATVTIGHDTVIAPNTHLRGETMIGEACRVGPNTIIESCTLGDRCEVLVSVLEFAIMEDDSDIGPFGHLRKGARICKGAHMGNFGEMKNSTLGPGAKMGHFSYLGDAEVGPEANIGAGTITCNYDGVRKHPTIIEEGAFIGSDTLLIAPVNVGARAKTGAGSVVTRDVPADTLAYGVPARIRGKQLSKDKEGSDDDER